MKLVAVLNLHIETSETLDAINRRVSQLIEHTRLQEFIENAIGHKVMVTLPMVIEESDTKGSRIETP